jgi:hypothetical protein
MEILRKETYLKMLTNSINTKLFNTIIVKDELGEVKDILNDGEYSCALFVSSILFLHSLTYKTRSTVLNLEKDLSENPLFIQISNQSEIESGDVLIWESVTYEDGSQNRHVGFAISDTEAVSTNYIEKCVTKHPINKEIENTGEVRKIEKIFRASFM